MNFKAGTSVIEGVETGSTKITFEIRGQRVPEGATADWGENWERWFHQGGGRVTTCSGAYDDRDAVLERVEMLNNAGGGSLWRYAAVEVYTVVTEKRTLIA